jgi:hypothetical protein
MALLQSAIFDANDLAEAIAAWQASVVDASMRWHR